MSHDIPPPPKKVLARHILSCQPLLQAVEADHWRRRCQLHNSLHIPNLKTTQQAGDIPLLELDPIEGIQRSIGSTAGNGCSAASFWVAPVGDTLGTSDAGGLSNLLFAVPSVQDTCSNHSKDAPQQSLFNGNGVNPPPAQPMLPDLWPQTQVKEEQQTACQTADFLSDLSAAVAPSVAAYAAAAAAVGAAVADGGVAVSSGEGSLAALPGLLIACKIDNLRRILNHPMVLPASVAE